MKRLFGNTSGLKANQIQSLENFYRHRIPDKFLITPGLAADISRLSLEIRRQIGLLVNRQGRIAFVIVGSHHGIVIPDISEYRVAPGRLKGLRCIHTHLKKEPLTNDDFNDLVLLRLDIMAVITLTKDGLPYQVHASHIIPTSKDEKPYQMLGPLNPNQLDIGCLELIQALESELSHATSSYKANQGEEKALLVSVTTASRRKAIDSLEELKELAASNGIEIAGTVLQQRKKSDSRFLLGPGKLQELTIETLQKGATLLIFDQELNPSQIRSITNHIDLKVIDRTQLILDIFAQRAQTKEGKIQVGLAQLKYLLPRLITKNTAMSRLTGGIGGRGPGETKLEINRRRVRDSIARFEKALLNIKKQRKHQKAKRSKKGLPVISIIGYTNSGKSTLLNTLTKSNVLAESRLFATLDPSSRRLKFPKDTEVIITDTVGFIKDLPKDLMVAFRATLEELESADLLLHVIDISSPRFKDQIKSVEKILSDLNLHNIPLIRVLNKQDLVDMETISRLSIDLDGTPISAINRSTLMPLIEKMENAIQHLRKFY
ncbi:MAG: GTPase HflX [Proteobacteria bacterium]|nr:GTPase HflX [Pseudomonadota bacterium]MBU4387957.1 GTPase HflX [Pseudomonadota bacterium]MBU4421238.1 GTPase HflX [Pseudomonadota bacterium]MBU4503175.1 GTPase HflX [Pseudomonadota bacterium]MCG2831460.1 GTPase HflX [Desulfobacteraceae bacterium]